MGKNRRRQNEEINLTPLLDVIFTVLFIVMLTGAVSQESKEKAHAAELGAQADAYETQMAGMVDKAEADALNEKIAALETQIEALEDAAEGWELYESEAVLVTMENSVREDAHFLSIYTGQNAVYHNGFKMGADLTAYAGERVADIISEIADDAAGRPVYVVFHCKKDIIYTAEKRAIEDALQQLKETYKEVFYQIVEE